MFLRQVSRTKTLLLILFYTLIYTLISYVITSGETVTFVSKELQVGSKYAFIFLIAPGMPVFSDADGADVFTTRKCGPCFITNNKGFLPMKEYDAVLSYGEKAILTESALMEPWNMYLISTEDECVENKLKYCDSEPVVRSLVNMKTGYSLCELCHVLLENKEKTEKKDT